MINSHRINNNALIITYFCKHLKYANEIISKYTTTVHRPNLKINFKNRFEVLGHTVRIF